MAFFEIEKMVRDNSFTMASLHSHNYFEIYFLFEGKRDIFIDKAMYAIEGGTVAIIPPFAMHKTEGGAFSRININISLDALQPDEQNILLYCAKKRIMSFKGDLETERLLQEIYTLWTKGTKNEVAAAKMLAKSLFVRLYMIKNDKILKADATSLYEKTLPPTILKIIKYINENYKENVTQESVGKSIYLSSGYAAKLFKKHTGFTISEYVLNLRINKAKQLLIESGENVEKISEECGFSSASYFGLIFKKKVGLSPLNFKKHGIY